MDPAPSEPSPPLPTENVDRFSDFRRVGRTVIRVILLFAAGVGLLAIIDDGITVHGRLAELRGFRAGIPATMLPDDRRYREGEIIYKGERMTLRTYPSAASGVAASSDYAVIVNRERIVEAAFSTDREAGREWPSEHRTP